jgi:hypothetical protein
MAGYGFTNKKDLTKWNDEDMQKAKACKWMIDRDWKNYPDSIWETFKECRWWYQQLMECLPSPERYTLKERLKNKSMFFEFDIFVRQLQIARYDMVMKLRAYEYQKAEMISKSSQPILNTSNQFGNTSISEDYRIKQLTQMYPKDTPADIKQREEKVKGYVPIKEILLKIPPMEIFEYCGFKLIKYDIWHGYYAIMLIDNNKQIKIFYDENAKKIELQAETEFEKITEEYLKTQENKNGYGNKTYSNVDISNIKQAMGYDEPNNPLNSKEIF